MTLHTQKYDTQHKDAQYKDAQHKDAQHKDAQYKDAQHDWQNCGNSQNYIFYFDVRYWV